MAEEESRADDLELTPSLLIEQFVQDVLDFSSQYGSDSSISYSAFNLIGKPNVYPNYGDYTDAFVLRTFGPWWMMAPSKTYAINNKNTDFYSQDFVDVKFEHKVYPLHINVYEIYNPGAVVRISAFDSVLQKWETLWQGIPLKCSSQSRIFSPPIHTTSFPTDTIRLEFSHFHLEYYSELDAVLLLGSLKPLYPRTNLTLVCEKLCSLALNPTICANGNVTDNLDLSETHECLLKKETSWFDKLPSEVFQLIISHLDLQSLCRASCVNRTFYQHCSDSLLYTEVDLQPCWAKVSESALNGLQNRCTNLQKLNLSWCGHYDRISSESFIRFIDYCGKNLTCLRLANCRFLTSESLEAISSTCSSLQELDLRCCRQTFLDHVGFLSLSRLHNLCKLNLYRTLIDQYSIFKIIQHNPHLEYLNLGACTAISNFDEIAVEIGHFCKKLKALDLWRARSLTAFGVLNLARHCSNLEELDIGWCMEVSTVTGCIVEIAQGCPKIRKLFMSAIRTINDNDINAIATYCCQIEQLDIVGTREVSFTAVLRLLQQCKNLKYIDVSFCAQIDEDCVQRWRQCFPEIAIKRSYQCILPQSN